MTFTTAPLRRRPSSSPAPTRAGASWATPSAITSAPASRSTRLRLSSYGCHRMRACVPPLVGAVVVFHLCRMRLRTAASLSLMRPYRGTIMLHIVTQCQGAINMPGPSRGREQAHVRHLLASLAPTLIALACHACFPFASRRGPTRPSRATKNYLCLHTNHHLKLHHEIYVTITRCVLNRSP